MYHKLLKKQIQETLGEEGIPTNLQPVFAAISKSYERWDTERPTYQQVHQSLNGNNGHQNGTKHNNDKDIEKHLNTAQRLAATGSWELSFKEENYNDWHFSFLSEEACRILCFEPGTMATSSAFYDRMHPADKAVFQRSLEIMMQAGGHHTAEYRLILPDGRMRAVRQTAEAFFNKNGNCAKITGTLQDITTFRQTELELQKAHEAIKAFAGELKTTKEELESANKELDMYVYSVSHDLRAPLSSILGLIGHAETETADEETLQYYKLIKNSVVKLDTFIQETLNDIRNAKKEIRRGKISFEELAAEVANNLKYMGGKQTNVTIRTNIEQKTAFFSDKNLISTILNNLVSNAIRYNNPNEKEPYVEIAIRAAHEKAHLSIKDNGIGISKENHDKLFGMFYRVSADYAGSGLGLHIVQEAVTKLHGTITFESEPEVGTVFNIDIPNML